MRKILGLLPLCCFVLAGFAVMQAQDKGTAPPKVLVITREWLKPGRAGAPHVKTESMFVRASQEAKWPEHYLAMDSMTGASRSLFFYGYDSFAAWEKDTQDTTKNSALSAALAKASVADGDLLSGIETSAWVYREDLSYHAEQVNVAQERYFEISQFRVHPGHAKEWESVIKTYQDNFGKAVPDTHWAVYESVYGKENTGRFLVMTPMKSLAEVDKGFSDSKKFEESLGEEGLKKLHDMEIASSDLLETNMFSFNPAESYVPPEWIKSDEYWKPKAPAAEKRANQ